MVSTAVDSPERRGLAELDSRLRQLHLAFDPRTVARLARERLRHPSEAPVSIRVGRILRARYEPSMRCRVVHRLVLERVGEDPIETIGVVDVTSAGLEIHWFHDDHDLPWLAEATDPDRMRFLAGPDRRPFERVVRIVPLRYTPGSRCLLRYEVETSAGRRSVLGKVVAWDGRRLFADLERLSRGEEQPDGTPPFLPPLAYVRDLHLFILPDHPAATSLHALIFDERSDPDVRLGWLRKAGAALARLHDLPPPDGPDHRLADHAEILARYSAAVAAGSPSLGRAFDEGVERIGSVAGREPSVVPSHGSFRTDQVLVDEEKLRIVDLDRLCRASPAADIGNALAYLRWRGIREPRLSPFIERARDRFLDGYGSRRAAPGHRWISRYEATALVKIAGRRFRSLAFEEWPLVPRLLDEALALLGRADARRGASASVRGTSGSRETRVAPPARTDRGQDPAPPGDALVRAALDVAVVRERLEGLMAPLPAARPTPLVTAARIVDHKPGHRWTIRYDAEGLKDGVIGKVYRDLARAAEVHDIMERLSNSTEPGAERLGVPRPLGWVPALHMVLYLPVRGRSLGAIIAGGEDGAEHAAEAAAWLRAFHGSSLPLNRRLDMDTELSNVLAWGSLVGKRRPDQAAAAAGLGRLLAEEGRKLRLETNKPIHKDFHYRHVFVGDRLAVIDFDEVRLGDPTFDLAHFCAYLTLLGCRLPAGAGGTADLRDVFLRAYGGGRRPPPHRAFRAFYAYTCMKIAKQLCTNRGVHPHPRDEEQGRQTAFVLQAGLEALRSEEGSW